MARQGTLQKLQPIRSPVILPQGSEPHGQTPDGVPLYRLVRKRSYSLPDYEPIHTEACGFDHDWIDNTVKDPLCRKCHIQGHQRHKKHQLTGEELVGIRKPVIYDEELIFYWEDELNGNAGPRAYVPPSQEELDAKAREAKRQQMQEVLLDVLVDGDVDPNELVRTIKEGKTTPVTETEPEVSSEPEMSPEPEKTYPHMYAPGRWELSNGTKMRGKKVDAEEAERAINETREVAEALPEY